MEARALLTVRRLADLGPVERRRILDRTSPAGGDVENAVRDIVADVKRRGDAALLDLAERFDGVRPPALVIGKAETARAWKTTAPTLRKVLERARRNLVCVAEGTKPPETTEVEVEPGLTVAERHVPLRRVGCYVPGGKAAYPSSVLMCAVPARIAGVRDIVVATPPGPHGAPPPAVLAACHLAEVDEVLVAGGAQAIAALAYGTESVRPVEKVVGPGNRYVTEAKRLVFGTVGIDSPAGPTEVLILADGSADPGWVALDLVAQAEHAEDARCLLVTTDERLAEAVAERILIAMEGHPRRPIIERALRDHGKLLVAASRDEACAFATVYAPEHLQIMTAEPARWASSVPTAGTTFLGPYAPVAAGDYLTGADHVLPTMAASCWAAPLSVHDFLRRTTEQTLTAEAARALVDDLAVFARNEGLEGHARSMEARRNKPKETAS